MSKTSASLNVTPAAGAGGGGGGGLARRSSTFYVQLPPAPAATYRRIYSPEYQAQEAKEHSIRLVSSDTSGCESG